MKLAHKFRWTVDACNSTSLEQQFLPRDSSLLSDPSVSGWKLELEGKSYNCTMFPSESAGDSTKSMK